MAIPDNLITSGLCATSLSVIKQVKTNLLIICLCWTGQVFFSQSEIRDVASRLIFLPQLQPGLWPALSALPAPQPPIGIRKGAKTKKQCFQCVNCEQKFTTKLRMDSHRNLKHLNLRPHICDSCQVSYYSRLKKLQSLI